MSSVTNNGTTRTQLDTVLPPHPAQCAVKPTTPNRRPRLNDLSYAPYTNEGRKHTIPDLHNRDVPYGTAQDGIEDAYGKGKGEVHPRTGHEGPEREQRYSSSLSLTSALDADGWSSPRPGRFTPGKTRYPLYRRLGEPQRRYGRVRKISPPPGFDPRTVQPVAGRYTDCAIPARQRVCSHTHTRARRSPAEVQIRHIGTRSAQCMTAPQPLVSPSSTLCHLCLTALSFPYGKKSLRIS
jgi:hypothetical protein